jgi:hypothetical protein
MSDSKLPTTSIAARGRTVFRTAGLLSTFAGEAPERWGQGAPKRSANLVADGPHTATADIDGTGRHSTLQPLAVTVVRTSLRPERWLPWPGARQRKDWRRRLSKRAALRFEILDSTDSPGGRNGSH